VVEYLLQSAKKSLYIQTQYITDPEIREILKGKIDQIELKILVADTVDNTDLVSYF
jgi:phosphatidylserine/phosphatidylglycerophosphate/cardiolipin synthase-like enzyme